MYKQYRWYIVFGGCIGMASMAFAAPGPQAPANPPAAKVAASRPMTTVSVKRPTTAVTVSRPKTTVQVSHPVTSVKVLHPQTLPSAAGENAAAAVAPTKQAVDNSAVAASTQKPSMMSSYQAPKAKDFKAAPTGGGEAGLGNKPDEKDPAKLPQAKTPDLASLLKGTDGGTKAKITKDIESKTK